MTVTAVLLERWKEAKGITSDRQAGLALGVSHTAVQKWKDHGNATAAIIEKMARDLGHNDREIAVMLFESMAEAANADAESRKTLERLAKKVRTLALTAVAVLASSSLFPAPAKARALGFEEVRGSIHYANLRRWLRALQRRLYAAFGIPAGPSTGVSPDGTSPLLRGSWAHGLLAPAA